MALTDIDGARLADNAFSLGKNLIINGAMRVAQRGTSSTASDYGTVDRFSTSYSGGTITTTQEALSSGTPFDEGFRNFVRLTNTSVVTNTATHYRGIYTYLEGQDIAHSGWNYTSSTSYLTLSFWVRASVSQAYSIRLRTLQGTSQNFPMSTGTLTADTWTKITKTIPGDSSIGFTNTNGAGLRVDLAPFWGTDYTDSGVSLDSWAAFSAGTRTQDMTTTWATTAGATFDITGVQLEVGSVATPFEHRSYGDELRRCQRYYQRIESDGNSDPIGIGYNEGTTEAKVMIDFPVTMRAAPSSLEQTGTASDYEVRSGSTTNCSSVPVIGPATTNCINIIFILSGLTNSQACQVRFRISGVFLAWSAEL